MMPSLWQLDPARLPGPLKKVGKKELHLWVGAWLADRGRKMLLPEPRGTQHLLFALCDHYEPLHGDASLQVGIERVRAWRERYPDIARGFRDTTGRPPRHSYFFPGEQYDPRLVEPLGELSELGLGEVEVHLHHDRDTRESLRASLTKTLADLSSHGLIPSKEARARWAFIHGNWCLANARRDGRWCGVDDEMTLLHELGCYADLTFPSAPDQCQPGIVNSIYYPTGDVAQRRAYEHGKPVRVGSAKEQRLLMIEGPIALARRASANGRRVAAVRIESASLSSSDPPSAARLDTWVRQRVGILGRPEWTFVKVHTHGAPESQAKVMLGEPVLELHRALQAYNDGTRWQLHYVTAREMYNVARAAMDGLTGSPADHYDYEIPPPPRARA